MLMNAGQYRIAFTERRQPRHSTFDAVYHRVAKNGYVAPQTIGLGRKRSACTSDDVFCRLSGTIQVTAYLEWP